MEHREKKDLDQIQIRGLRVYAYHGVKESEKEKGQPFELDITPVSYTHLDVYKRQA